GGLTKMMVEETQSQTCGVWLIDESGERVELWMVYVKDRLYTPRTDDWDAHHAVDEVKRLGCASLEQHLFDYRPGWNETIEYAADDPRLPEAFRVFARRMNSAALVATPMSLGNRTLGWMTMSVAGPLDRRPSPERRTGRRHRDRPQAAGRDGPADREDTDRCRDR